MEIMEDYIPKVTISIKHNLPWMNRNIKAKLRKRNSVYRRARKTGHPSLWKNYTSLRNEVITILRKSKREHLKVSRQGCKQFWKTVKSLKKAYNQIPTLKTDSIIASSNTAKASLLNNVFSQNFNTSTHRLTDIDFMTDPSSPYPEEIFCTEEGVSNLLLALDTSKASGSDGISGRMLKGTSHSIVPVLTNLLNLSIKTGKIPQKWKTSSIVPIPKSQTNTDDPCNYRPISLLPVVSKLLERHMCMLG